MKIIAFSSDLEFLKSTSIADEIIYINGWKEFSEHEQEGFKSVSNDYFFLIRKVTLYKPSKNCLDYPVLKKKLVPITSVIEINTSIDYIDKFFYLDDESTLITETQEDFYNRYKTFLGNKIYYQIQPYIVDRDVLNFKFIKGSASYSHYKLFIESKKEIIFNFFHKEFKGICTRLISSNIHNFILSPTIDYDQINEIIQVEIEDAESWADYDMFDGYGDEEIEAMDEETNGFWRIQND